MELEGRVWWRLEVCGKLGVWRRWGVGPGWRERVAQGNERVGVWTKWCGSGLVGFGLVKIRTDSGRGRSLRRGEIGLRVWEGWVGGRRSYGSVEFGLGWRRVGVEKKDAFGVCALQVVGLRQRVWVGGICRIELSSVGGEVGRGWVV